jgi:serine phosphatase RsbU (regulator of sigma subunit)/anti-sigma regulatory factor (Ser/Thr protein kinase)
MHTEEALAACRVGVWRWHNGNGRVTLDAVAAELLGLPPEPVTLPEPDVRARFHVSDYLAAQRFLAAAASEGQIAEAEVRVVDRDGTVLRTLRSRARAVETERPGGPGAPAGMVGTFSELPGASRPALPDEADEEWRRAREAFVLDAGQALSEARSVREVLGVVSTLSMPGFQPTATGVFSRDGGELRMVEFSSLGADVETDTETAESVRRDVARGQQRMDAANPAVEALLTGRAVYVGTQEEFQERYPELWPAIAHFPQRSRAYLPLVVAGRTIGVWLVAFDEPLGFTFEERSLLATIARLLAQALSRAFLQETERELSADLQHTMRPAPTPSVPGMRIATRYVPTGGGLRVGGDWYDVIPLPSGRVALIIGDVQGHDVRAAAIMAQLRIALRAYAAEGHHPDAVLSRASRFLATLAPTAGKAGGEPDDRFATCLYVEVDPPSGTLDIARAGHPDPAMFLEDGTLITRPTAGGLPLGIDPAEDYPITRLVLEPGESLLLCTDGLIEAGRRDLDAGWSRLRQAVAGLGGGDLEEVADVLIETARGAEREAVGWEERRGEEEADDIALLLLNRPDLAGKGTVPRAPARRVMLTVGQSEPARIAEARGQLDALLHDWGDQERVFGAALMLSEAVTNVLTHTEGDALLVAELSGRPGRRLLRVEVTDPSDELPHLRHPGELATSGRGLMLMESLSDAWGVAPRGEGKTTWFELRETAPAPVPRTEPEPGPSA